jgi:hypothetical protein
VGNYLFMWESESVARRDPVAPAPGQRSEEGQRYIEATATLWKALNEMAMPSWQINTDYVVIASS